MPNNNTYTDKEQIYTEEKIILIKPLKARVFDDRFEKQSFYTQEGEKVILLREKNL